MPFSRLRSSLGLAIKLVKVSSAAVTDGESLEAVVSLSKSVYTKMRKYCSTKKKDNNHVVHTESILQWVESYQITHHCAAWSEGTLCYVCEMHTIYVPSAHKVRRYPYMWSMAFAFLICCTGPFSRDSVCTLWHAGEHGTRNAKWQDSCRREAHTWRSVS